MKCGSLPARWTFIMFVSTQLTAIISLDILPLVVSANWRVKQITSSPEKYDSRVCACERLRWVLLFFSVYGQRNKRKAKSNWQKKSWLNKWTKRKMVAIDAYVPFLHIHSNTQTVEITAWSNRNLRNFLIFCISLGVLLGAYFSSDVQNSVLISLNRKSFQTLGQFVWHTRRETTWSACTMRITEQPNIRNRLIGALTEITLTMDLRISQLIFCSPRCACAWLSLSFSFYFPFLSSFLFFIAVCVYAFCACLLFK